MELKTYLNGLPDEAARKSFADLCGTTLGHMRNCVYMDGKQLHPAVCVLVERHSEFAVTRQELRSDWPAIWPELDCKAKPAAEAA